jgi:hypothetical protein
MELMTEPTPDQLRAIEREFASAFAPSSADEMSPRAFDRLLDDLLAHRSPDAFPVVLDRCPVYGTERVGVSWESYDAQRQDWHRAIAKKRLAEDALKAEQEDNALLQKMLKRSESETDILAVIGLALLVAFVGFVAWRGM